jgi:hypothetical protein
MRSGVKIFLGTEMLCCIPGAINEVPRVHEIGRENISWYRNAVLHSWSHQ